MRTRTRTCALAGVLVIVLGLGACGDDDDDDDASPSGTEADAGDEGGDGGGGDADVTIVDFAFDPSTPTVAAGDTISITNEDSATHTFSSTDGGFDVNLPGGDSGEATAPSEPGDYEFQCNIHGQMTGTLTVE